MPDVRVPQKDGPIIISVDGGEPVTRYVTDHTVAVAEDDLDLFLQVVDGAEVVEPDKKSSKS